MPTLVFILDDGRVERLAGRVGMSVMEIALRHGVPGIDAKCRGSLGCATCHVWVEGEAAAALAPPTPMEVSMLDFASDVDARSRLSCQIRLDDATEGLIVRAPPRQYVWGM